MTQNKRQSEETIMALIGNDVARIKSDVSEIKNNMERNYVTLEAFEPIRRIVYGLVALILIGFVGALIALVYKGGK
jgi:hypothetical protein